MELYWIKTPALIKKIFSKYVWSIPNDSKTVYLTFDDGPTPEITEWTLEQLKKHSAKATFFCIGNNIESHPEIFEKVINEGHAIGNHTFDHINGWGSNTKTYIQNTMLCESLLSKFQFSNNNLFRPPYGKIKRNQSKELRKKGYRIIMWDVLSADYDTTIAPEKCLNNVIRNVKSGSIIIFHDSKKAFKNLEYALPRTLQFLNENGFKYDVI